MSHVELVTHFRSLVVAMAVLWGATFVLRPWDYGEPLNTGSAIFCGSLTGLALWVAFLRLLDRLESR